MASTLLGNALVTSYRYLFALSYRRWRDPEDERIGAEAGVALVTLVTWVWAMLIVLPVLRPLAEAGGALFLLIVVPPFCLLFWVHHHVLVGRRTGLAFVRDFDAMGGSARMRVRFLTLATLIVAFAACYASNAILR